MSVLELGWTVLSPLQNSLWQDGALGPHVADWVKGRMPVCQTTSYHAGEGVRAASGGQAHLRKLLFKGP